MAKGSNQFNTFRFGTDRLMASRDQAIALTSVAAADEILI
jgi:hypothetical protein